MIKKFLLSVLLVISLFSSFGHEKQVEAATCTPGNLNYSLSPTTISAPTDVSMNWANNLTCEYIFVSPDPLASNPQWIYVTASPYVVYGVNSTQTYAIRAYANGVYPYPVFNGDNTGVDGVVPTMESTATVTYNAPQTASLTVNVVDQNGNPLSGASWNVFGGSPTPSPSSGSGSSVLHTVYPSLGGTVFSVGNVSGIAGKTGPVISNSDFGGSSITLSPGQSKWIRLTYTDQTPPCTVNLYTSSNSIVNGNSATLTWSSSNTVSPYTSGTNFNTGGAATNMIGVSVSPTVTTTYTITGYDNQSNCTSSQTITVTNPPAPTVSLTATPSCNGNVSEIILSWSGTNATSYTVRRDNASGAVIYSGSATSFTDSNRTANQSYTYHITATGPGGSVSQTASATAPNCAAPQPPSIVSFVAFPVCNGNNPGMSVSWNVSNNPTNYIVKRDNAAGAVIYNGPATSFVDTPLSSNTSYTYYLEAANGTSPNATQTVSATTGSCAGQAPTVTLTAAPNNVSSGGASNMNWSVGGGTATSCTVSANPANAQWSGSLPAGDITAGGHVKTISNITVNTTFSITCSNANGQNSSSAAVTVSAGPIPVVSISANPGTVTSGNSSALTWSVTNNPSSCTASGGWSGNQAASGNNVSTGPLFVPTTFSLSCSNGNGTGSNSTQVSVSGGGLSDLVGGLVTTNTSLTNSNQRIFANIHNNGPFATSPSVFPYVFQITNAANGGGSVVGLPTSFVSGSMNAGQQLQVNVQFNFTSVGTYSARVCPDANSVSGVGPTPSLSGGVVSETNENNCGPWGNIIVTNGTYDLVTSAAYTNTQAAVSNMQQPWYFAAYITNKGTSATPGGGFPMFAQLASQADGGGTIINFSGNTAGSYQPNWVYSSGVFASGQTFSQAGTQSVRICSDATGVNGNLATGGVLSESDETNNCGPWTNFDVVADASVIGPATINVFSNLPSSWTLVPWPASGQTINPASGSGTQSTHSASGGSYIYTLSNIQSIPGYSYSVSPSTMQNIYAGRTYSYTINYVSNASFDYSLINGGNVTVVKSSVPTSGQANITKTLSSGATQAVDITATGMPSGVSIAYANRSCSPTCSSTITFTVDPTTTPGTYPITVTANTAGLADKTTSFNLIVVNPVGLTVSCSASPSPAYVGQPVTWTGSIVGGTPPYTYTWSGSDFGTGNTNPFTFAYQSTGTKNATLLVTDSAAASGSCPSTNVGITIDPRYKEF